MPKTKFQSFIYTIMMCAFMVMFMSIYNTFLHLGVSWATLRSAFASFPVVYVIALICDWFLVSGPAKRIAFCFVQPSSSSIAKIIAISSCMVIGMVLLMSLYGAIKAVGATSALPYAWIRNIPVNFVMALPFQLLIAGPIIRFIFSKIPFDKTTAE